MALTEIRQNAKAGRKLGLETVSFKVKRLFRRYQPVRLYPFNLSNFNITKVAYLNSSAVGKRSAIHR